VFLTEGDLRVIHEKRGGERGGEKNLGGVKISRGEEALKGKSVTGEPKNKPRSTLQQEGRKFVEKTRYDGEDLGVKSCSPISRGLSRTRKQF